MRDLLLIVNYDARYSADVAKILRADGVYCQIVEPDYRLSSDRNTWPLGIIFSGSVDENLPTINPELLAPGLPVLGLGNAAASLCE
jgi:GMP synthase-like glutamine amidotransferase